MLFHRRGLLWLGSAARYRCISSRVVSLGSKITEIRDFYGGEGAEDCSQVNIQARRWTCRRWKNISSVGDMLDEFEWPSLESRRERSSLGPSVGNLSR